MSDARPDVLIVGAGLAGLCCALHLQRAGARPLVLEASDAVGGRQRTDRVEGFLLDRGFQVLLTAYPEARAILDEPQLALGRFDSGALIRCGGRFHRIIDPFRPPPGLRRALTGLIGTALSPAGTLADKLRILRLRRRVCRGPVDAIAPRPGVTALDALRLEGFSERVIDRFFRPFFGGVFLDAGLGADGGMLEFLFRMFSLGEAALPAAGIGAIPAQIAARLPQGTIRLGARVDRIDSTGVRNAATPGRHAVTLTNGERLEAGALVLAVQEPEAASLLGAAAPPPGRSVTCLYFAAPEAPIADPVLVLDGEGRGPVNNLCVPSAVHHACAPAGQALISATVLGIPAGDDRELENRVRAQMTGWFGDAVSRWRHLRTYRIAHALPASLSTMASGAGPVARPAAGRLRDGVYVCGDYTETASIQGAMLSGRRAAQAILAAARAA